MKKKSVSRVSVHNSFTHLPILNGVVCISNQEKENDMRHNSTTVNSTACVLAGMAVGALAMYMLDPVQGNRRRALARDKAYSAKVHAGKWVDATSRDLANRAKGVCAKTGRVFSHSHRHEVNSGNSNPETQEASL